MADKIRHIKGRNLVVCETFDDFAAAVNKTDFTVEDVVGYVTSLTNVYYWLNIESVWGAIGFTWTPSSLTPLTDEEALQYPNPLYRLEQVTAEGENIPMDQQWLIDHKLSKGTGVFNRTTIPFSHIPKVPDGHRVTAITGTTLASINPDIKTLYIDKSNWVNLTNISNICNRAITLYVDLDGAPITTITPLITGNVTNKLYLKADLSNAINGSTLFNSSAGNLNSYLVANDYYKDLNFPIGKDSTFFTYIHGNAGNRPNYGDRDFHPGLRWEGEGPFKLEYFFDIKDYTSVYMPPTGYGGGNRGVIKINSKNGIFHIMNYTNYDPLTLNSGNGIHLYINSAGEATAVDLTIDCTNGISDVRCDYDLAIRNEGSSSTYRMLPIKYEGNVTSIGIYNPFLNVSENQWPIFDQSLVNKMDVTRGEYILKGLRALNSKCPYTIDMSNKTYFRVFYNAAFSFNDTSFRTPIPNVSGQYYCDYYPTYIGMDHHFDVIDFRDNVNSVNNYRAKLPSGNFEADTLNVQAGHYFPSDFKVTITRLTGTGPSSYPHTVYADVSKPIFKLVPKEGMNILFNMNTGNRNILGTWVYVGSIGNALDIVELDDSISDTEWDEYLKAGDVMTFRNFDKPSVSHPAIASNAGHSESNDFHGDEWGYYKNFRLIYRSDIKLAYANYTDAELIAFAQSFRDHNNDVEYKVRLYYYIYDRLLNLQGHNYIADIVNLGYNVSRFTP